MGLAPLPVAVRRVVYLGTPQIAVAPLQALIDSEVDVVAVVTGEPRRRGRRAPATPTPVAQCAAAAGIPIHHDLSPLDDPSIDLGVIVAFGTIIPGPVLAQVPMVNLHFSLLPRWRGAAPVERALLAGDDRTGVCVMVVEESLDTGGVLACVEEPIRGDDTSESLALRLSVLGGDLLATTLGGPLPSPTSQQGEPVYADKIGKSDVALDWSLSPEVLERRVRTGGAWTTCRGRRLKVTSARIAPAAAEHLAPGVLGSDGKVLVGAGDGALELVEVVPDGRTRQPAVEWLRGLRPETGEILGGGQ